MQKIINYKTYILVWIALILLTGITILIAKMNIRGFSVLMPLFIAASKAALVAAYFMHLAYEQRLFKLIFFIAILTVTVIIGFTFFDIGFRVP